MKISQGSPEGEGRSVERAALRGVFLDAGGVLVLPGWERVIRILNIYGVNARADELAGKDPVARFEVDRPDHPAARTDASRWAWYVQRVLALAGIDVGDNGQSILRDIRAEHQRRNLWDKVPDDVREALVRLRRAGLRLIVVSNSDGTVATLLERLALAEMFDFIIDSECVGVEKPHPEIFRIALHRAGLGAHQVIHIGDLYQVDVLGARAAGIPAALLDMAGLYGEVDCPRFRTLSAFADWLLE